jgi:hypothetical protein
VAAKIKTDNRKINRKWTWIFAGKLIPGFRQNWGFFGGAGPGLIMVFV